MGLAIIDSAVVGYKPERFLEEGYVYTERQTTIPETVIEIGRYAFKGCYSLMRIALPDTLKVIGEGAFEDCGNLEEIEIPYGVTEIKRAAFKDCNDLKKVTLPDSLKTLGAKAFFKCASLKSLRIPASVTCIGQNACRFYGNVEIAEQNPVYASMDGMLYNKDKTSLLQVPLDRERVSVPDSVTEIGTRALARCYKLVGVELPAHLKKIGIRAFAFCDKLTEITIPSEVEEIGLNAFAGSYALRTIVLEPGNTHFQLEEGVLYDSERTRVVHFPFGQRCVKLADTVRCFEPRLFTDICEEVEYRGLRFRAGGNKMRVLLDAVINGNFIDFFTELTLPEQYDAMSKMYQLPFRHAEAERMIQEELEEVFCYLIEENETAMVEDLILQGEFDLSNCVDKLIACAIEKECFQVQLLLMDYKNKKGGYDGEGAFSL